MSKILITSVEFWNLKGFEHFSARLGQFVVCCADNGGGKTSFVRGMKMFFEPGGDPELIRRGTEEARGIVTFSNGYSAEKVVRRDGYEIRVLNPEGGECKAPVTLLEKLLPKKSFDPQGFLDAMDGKQRTDFILDHLPISFQVTEINHAGGTKLGKLDIQTLDRLPDGPDKTLEEFQRFYSEVSSSRAAINSSIDTLRGAEKTLMASLPQDDATNWGIEAEQFQKQVGEIDQAIASAESDIKLEAEQARSDTRKMFGAEIKDAEELRAAYIRKAHGFVGIVEAFAGAAAHPVDERIKIMAGCDALHADVEEFCEAARQARQLQRDMTAKLERIGEAETTAIQNERAARSDQRAELAQKLGEAREKAAQQERGKGVKEALDKQREKLAGEAIRYEQLTLVMDALDRLKSEKLREVKIPGFDIKFERQKGTRKESAVILIHGVPIDSINRQQALFVALQLVLLAQKDNDSDEVLPFAIMETAELVPSRREELREAAEAAGLQLVITVPVDGETLTVTSL